MTAIGIVLVWHRDNQNQRGKGILPSLQTTEVHQRHAEQFVEGEVLVRAKVLGDAPFAAVEMRVDEGAWTPMQPVPGEVAL